jgi:diguanylate cyclase (GGDEF)-like protein
MLEIIAPQMALAIDRDEWYVKATQSLMDDEQRRSKATTTRADSEDLQSIAAQFQLLSLTDPLTGLLNRRYLEERLSEEINRSKRYDYSMSFMMIDVDDFKNYNDLNGHAAGDEALQMVAQCLKSTLRSADVAVRYGGEEFSVLLPQTTAVEARVIAERVRLRVEQTIFPHGKTQPLNAVTVSIGISSFSRQLDTAAQIIYAADRALYLAKSRGKNSVQEFE